MKEGDNKDNELKFAREDLKMQILHLAKEILQNKAAMKWETHKQCEDISVDVLISEAEKIYQFIQKD